MVPPRGSDVSAPERFVSPSALLFCISCLHRKHIASPGGPEPGRLIFH